MTRNLASLVIQLHLQLPVELQVSGRTEDGPMRLHLTARSLKRRIARSSLSKLGAPGAPEALGDSPRPLGAHIGGNRLLPMEQGDLLP